MLKPSMYVINEILFLDPILPSIIMVAWGIR